jgi:uncharacterized membrane protein YjdF
MREIAFLAAVVLIGAMAATSVRWLSRRHRNTSFVAAFFAAYAAMLVSAYLANVLEPSHWQHGHLYLPSNWLQFLASQVLYKSSGLLALSLLCVVGPAISARFRRGA